MNLKAKEPTTADPTRPYPEGIAWDEAWRQRKRADRLEEALPNPCKLEALARWIDWNFENDPDPEVQTDLRQWAKKIRNAMEHQYDE